LSWIIVSLFVWMRILSYHNSYEFGSRRNIFNVTKTGYLYNLGQIIYIYIYIYIYCTQSTIRHEAKVIHIVLNSVLSAAGIC